ncbi:MAG: GGDEF domain-containing protein [Oscillospiraceae bacterium]|nr:GGDEF domain-containing protein [Oscillospiraceae bacterium]
MNFIGDYFALGLVIVLCVFFFDNKTGIRYMSASGKLFICCLFTTALTAVIDLMSGQLLDLQDVALWKHMLVNSLYFVVNIISTSTIALYLFTKILEHTYSRRCMRNACIGLAVLFVLYLAFVVMNLWTGWLFYFDEANNYCRGPLNGVGYLITLAQLGLVGICYLRNRQNASRPMRRALLQMFPIIPLCIIIQRTNPEIMLNGFIMALVDTVLFLSFQGQRQGVHTLTELNDRRRFFTEVDSRIAKKEPFQIFLINIKNFGSINQKHGHVFGDEYLYQFAFSLEKLLKGSLSFHMNGTVFAVIQRYTYQNDADRQSGELLEFLENGISCMDQHVDVDYVVVHYVADGLETTGAELYENMEYAGSKTHDRKQRYVRCTGEIREETGRHRYLRERIQTVDRQHGFEVWYQPIGCLSTGKFCSMEALIRLREPDGSLISPAEFIPLAEQTGHISPITWFVVEETCRLLKYSPNLDHVSVSINLPMDQLLEKGFVPRLVSTVKQAGIEPNRICLEFTERIMLDTFRQTLEVMQRLNQEGFRFYLDDFGTGYSTFNCLLQLPFRIIKLDTALVHSGRNGATDYRLVRTLTKLFHDMDLIVVAEGVETQEEVRLLQEQGVDRIQGYALARPMPVSDLLTFYQKNPVE